MSVFHESRVRKSAIEEAKVPQDAVIRPLVLPARSSEVAHEPAVSADPVKPAPDPLRERGYVVNGRVPEGMWANPGISKKIAEHHEATKKAGGVQHFKLGDTEWTMRSLDDDTFVVSVYQPGGEADVYICRKDKGSRGTYTVVRISRKGYGEPWTQVGPYGQLDARLDDGILSRILDWPKHPGRQSMHEFNPFHYAWEKFSYFKSKTALPWGSVPAGEEVTAEYNKFVARCPEDGIYDLPDGRRMYKVGDTLCFATTATVNGKEEERHTFITRNPITGEVSVKRMRMGERGWVIMPEEEQETTAGADGIAHKWLKDFNTARVQRSEWDDRLHE